MLSLTHIPHTDGHNNKHRQHQQYNIIEGIVKVEQVMVMVLFLEVIVVLLDHHVLPADHAGFSHPEEHLIVYFRALVDQAELCCVAVGHLLVELSVEEEGDEEPVGSDEPVGPILHE